MKLYVTRLSPKAATPEDIARSYQRFGPFDTYREAVEGRAEAITEELIHLMMDYTGQSWVKERTVKIMAALTDGMHDGYVEADGLRWTITDAPGGY